MSELICWCKEQGMAIGTARGSVGGSRVAYVTDIIDLNPETWHTVFSRFANEDRKEIGDIDIDCVESDRPAIFHHITSRFGDDKTARVASFGTMQSKGVIDDVGRHLSIKWMKEEHPNEGKLARHPLDGGHGVYTNDDTNPWSLPNIARIKNEFDEDPDKAKRKYPEIFYYYDGLIDTKISQSVHPAGMVISPITLLDNFGIFDKDNENCLMLDMDNIHDFTGLAKYDFLILKTVQVIRDTCNYVGIPYPKSHEIDWKDDAVWEDVIKSPSGIFQFESKFAFDSLKKFQPHSIFDMSLVTAAIRPSGASYRDNLLARIPHKNPSKTIDTLLADNLGYCIEGSQLVQTTGGLVPIKDVKEGDMVITKNGEHTVLKKTFMGQKPVVKLSHRNGEIRCTKDHRILTDKGFKKAEDITDNDSIAVRVGTSSTKTIDTDLLRVTGWLLGDGVLSVKRQIGFVNADYDVHKAFRECVERFDNTLTTTISNRRTINGSELYKSNVKFVTPSKAEKSIRIELRNLGLFDGDIGLKASAKRIPQRMLGLSRESLLFMLGAYTDTDSCIWNRVPVLKYTTSSVGMAYDLAQALRMVGIVASIYKQNESAYVVCASDAKSALAKLWGYSIKIRKKYPDAERLKNTRATGGGNVSRKYVRRIFENGSGVSTKRLLNDIGVNLYTKNKYICLSQVRKICCYTDIDEIKELCNENIVWSPFVSIEHAEKLEDVYDLTIEDEHNFVCEGIVVHNCLYQEDTIKFLQNICGLSGSDADNVRRAIGRKQKERLDKAMPDILDGYCNNSPQPRDIAEQEAKEFMQIIEDSASYQFGYNHSVAYCLLGYLCAYYRYYYPLEFITSFLNNAANEEDIRSGTAYANKVGIQVTMPKWGVSKSEYFYDKNKNIISKGLTSIKFMSSGVAEELYNLSKSKDYMRFTDVLFDIDQNSSLNTRQLDILIKLDFFSDFGNQRELFRITELFYDTFKKGRAKKIAKDKVDGTPLESIVSKYSVWTTKGGGVAKSYTLLDVESILHESEDAIKSVHMEDLDDLLKVRNFADVMGYIGYVSGKEEDRRKLYVLDVYPLARKKDNKQFGYSVVTKSIGSGKEARFTVVNKVYDEDPIMKGDIILCKGYEKQGQYFKLTSYSKVY